MLLLRLILSYFGTGGLKMKRIHISRDAAKAIVRCAALLAAVCIAISLPISNSEMLSDSIGTLTIMSARLLSPGEPRQEEIIQERLQAATVTPTELTSTVTTESTTVTTTTKATETTQTSKSGTKPVKETKIGNTGVHYKNIYVKNGNSKHDIDIKSVLAQEPDCRIEKNDEYQILIIHTHTTECFADSDCGYYVKGVSPRTTDKSKNIVAVGGVIADRLNKEKIKTLHVTTMHDYPKYNGSYDRAKETIKKYLKKYPSIKMVLDVHRDSMTKSDGTKLKPTVKLDGRKAAQVMIISGCDDLGKLEFPNWKRNLKMAVRIQKQMADDYPGLARPLYFAPFRYNMHLTDNSLLIEFGTEVNTLEEAMYSAELVSKSLIKVLNKQVK